MVTCARFLDRIGILLMSNKKIITPGRVILIIAVLVGVLSWVTDRKLASEPEYPAGASNELKAKLLLIHRITVASDELADVFVGDNWIRVTYKPKYTHDGEGWVLRTFSSTKKALVAIKGTGLDKYSKVIFQSQLQVSAPGGPTRYTNGLIMEYNLDGMKDVEYERLLTGDLGELPYNITFRRFGLESALEYCAVEKNLKRSPVFCRRAEAAR